MTFRICCLFPKRLFETKMSPGRRDYIKAVRETEAVSLVLTGQGWEGWDDACSAVENIERVLKIVGLSHIDAVWWYKWQGSTKDGVAPVRDPAAVSRRWRTVECFNECYWPNDKAARDVLTSGTRLVVCHHANDLPRFDFAKARASWPIEIVHIPHCFDPVMFSLPSDGDRPIDVLLTGNLRPDVYPLRARFARMIKTGRMPGVAKVYPHPGYRCVDFAACCDAVMDYVEVLGLAKIALVCSSTYRYPLAKYVEAAACGCLVVGDMPMKAPVGYEQVVAPIPTGATDEEIASHVGLLLDDPATLAGLRDAAKATAWARFTTARYAAEFVAAARRG